MTLTIFNPREPSDVEYNMESPETVHEQYIDIRTAAEFLGCTVGTLRVWTHKKMVPYYKIGRSVRFRISDLQDWANERRVETR